MRLDLELARLIAATAITEPYRQVDVLTTRNFARYLKERGISLQWETIHHLWKLGVLHPIAVLEPAISSDLDKERFHHINLEYDVASFVDLGQEVREDSEWSPPIAKLAGHLADSLLWHPFQLWVFHQLGRRLEVPIALDASLSTSESYSNLASKLVSHVPKRLVELANGSEYAMFLRLLALLLQVEPVVHISIESSIHLRPHLGESSDGYLAWREGFAGQAVLANVGLITEDVERWQHSLAVAAHINDPVNKFRILLRHANRRKLKRLEGPALLAIDLYDTAEVLRRYLEQFCGRELLEEDDAIYGPQGPEVKQRFYGSARTADFDRTVFRRIVRDFDLDPQARTTWFVEGDTEEAYIRRVAKHLFIDLDRAGVDVMNLSGLGGLTSDRLIELLERFQREEVFPFVSIDFDAQKEPLRWLRNYAKKELLPIGFRVWHPDFETSNFSLEELAEVANKMVTDAGFSTSITANEIEQEMNRSGKSARKAIKDLLWKKYQLPLPTGAEWGKALADWASGNPCSAGYADSEGNRPINALLLRLLRGQLSNYWETVKHFTVDDDGNLVIKE